MNYSLICQRFVDGKMQTITVNLNNSTLSAGEAFANMQAWAIRWADYKDSDVPFKYCNFLSVNSEGYYEGTQSTWFVVLKCGRQVAGHDLPLTATFELDEVTYGNFIGKYAAKLRDLESTYEGTLTGDWFPSSIIINMHD